MLTLHIEAENFAGLVEAAAKALGASVDRPNAQPTKQPEQPQAELPLPATDKPKGRPGRPRKTETDTSPQTAGASEGDSAGSQPEVEQNTGSDQADTPAAGGVVETEAGAGTSASVTISRDDLKAKLNQVKDKFTTNDDTMAGLTKVTEIINAFGYQKVKDIQEQHFGEIVVKCDEALAA